MSKTCDFTSKLMILLIVTNKLSVIKNTLMPKQLTNIYREKNNNE